MEAFSVPRFGTRNTARFSTDAGRREAEQSGLLIGHDDGRCLGDRRVRNRLAIAGTLEEGATDAVTRPCSRADIGDVSNPRDHVIRLTRVAQPHDELLEV